MNKIIDLNTFVDKFHSLEDFNSFPLNISNIDLYLEESDNVFYLNGKDLFKLHKIIPGFNFINETDDEADDEADDEVDDDEDDEADDEAEDEDKYLTYKNYLHKLYYENDFEFVCYHKNFGLKFNANDINRRLLTNLINKINYLYIECNKNGYIIDLNLPTYKTTGVLEHEVDFKKEQWFIDMFKNYKSNGTNPIILTNKTFLFYKSGIYITIML